MCLKTPMLQTMRASANLFGNKEAKKEGAVSIKKLDKKSAIPRHLAYPPALCHSKPQRHSRGSSFLLIPPQCLPSARLPRTHLTRFIGQGDEVPFGGPGHEDHLLRQLFLPDLPEGGHCGGALRLATSRAPTAYRVLSTPPGASDPAKPPASRLPEAVLPATARIGPGYPQQRRAVLPVQPSRPRHPPAACSSPFPRLSGPRVGPEVVRAPWKGDGGVPGGPGPSQVWLCGGSPACPPYSAKQHCSDFN